MIFYISLERTLILTCEMFFYGGKQKDSLLVRRSIGYSIYSWSWSIENGTSYWLPVQELIFWGNLVKFVLYYNLKGNFLIKEHKYLDQ